MPKNIGGFNLGLGFIKKNQRGFTFVEAIAVVAIIAILATTVGPTYERYILQSKMMEGPIALARVYSAEQEVFADSGTYVACVLALGIEPEREGYFVVGFNAGYNWGKLAQIVPDCAQSAAPYAARSTCTTNSREIECTRAVGDPPLAISPSETSIIPIKLLKRGSAPYRSPYVNASGAHCPSNLADNNNNSGTSFQDTNGVTVNNAPAPVPGLWRPDTQFKACALAALSMRTSASAGALGTNAYAGFFPTQYTIDDKKIIKLLNRGW